MNFEGAKENIQPLATGRNVEQLEVALNAESQQECQEELLQQRKEFEEAISNYTGDDPLELWFEYISWTEQSYPKSGKGSAIDELLQKCLSKFEKDSRYSQDPRFIRIFIKYIDTKRNPNLFYSKLYNSGVGTMVADLYIAWAHYYDLNDNFDEAKSVYQKGLDARAAPIEHLKQVYERFQFSVGQRIIRKEEYRQEFLSSMEAQRNAFTSLHSLKRSKVGSIRTGSAVKSFTPGQVQQNQSRSSSTSSSSNVPLRVYEGTSETTSKPPPQPYRSVVEEIENSTVENHIEPGPWSKPSSREGVFHNVHGNSTLKFAIHMDETEQLPFRLERKNDPPLVSSACNIRRPFIKLEPLPTDRGNLAINLPKNFARKNNPQTPFILPACIPEEELRTIPMYPKFYLHPNTENCFQPEELRYYNRLKAKNISNDFTESRDNFWGVDSNIPARILPNFPRQNLPQTDMETKRPDISSIPTDQVLACKLSALYPDDAVHELQPEEIWRIKRQIEQNNANRMDETVCVRGRQSFGVQHFRKSISGGGRKSIMPVASDEVAKLPATDDDSGSDMDLTEDDDGANVREEKASANALINEVDAFLQPNEVALFKKPLEFAIPQTPLARTAEKRTTESVPVKHNDIPTPAISSVKSPYPIGPQTGARSILRKSIISQHAISNNHDGNTNDNGAQLPPPDLDQSLCTQAFNVNLGERMASTPVAIRRTESLIDQIRSEDVVNPPMKLSVIMETTEGSASAASSKSANQFSSPEDDSSKWKSNVTNRTKLVGATVCADDEAAGACHLAGTTNSMNYSCNVEKTLPAVQLSILPDANPMAQNQRDVTAVTAAKDEPAKSYPFPIFEDTQIVTTVAPNMSREPNGLAVRSSRAGAGQFNETSVWIKDEPESFTVNDLSVAEESFVLPIRHQGDTLPPLVNTTESYNQLEGCEQRTKSQMDHSAVDDFSTLPNRQRKSMFPLTEIFNANQSRAVREMESTEFPNPSSNNSDIQLKEEPQTDVSTTEESFALPIRPRKSIAPPIEKSDDLEASQTKSDSQMVSSSTSKEVRPNKSCNELRTDVSTTEESFALPNELRGDVSTTEESFALPNELRGDVSTTEESFALPNIHQPVAETSSSNMTFENAEESSDSEEEVIEVPDESFIEAAPKIVNVQSLANRNDIENRFETSTRISISFTADEVATHENNKVSANAPANLDGSIYFYSITVQPNWTENYTKEDAVDKTVYQHEEVNLEESRIFIQTQLAEEYVDPFNDALRNALLTDLQFMDLLKTDASCDLIGTVPTVAVKRTIPFKDSEFSILKCIGHGAYGRVFNAKWLKDGSTYAVKKEMPANVWEYYILKQVHSRVVENLSGYMKADMAIIANDGSLLFSQYSQYGTLLDVCNHCFTSTNANINESIVFILAYQMLDLVDRLHKADILHLDLKPDNFLVMRPMSTNHRDLFIQLIDFGNSVDLRQYRPGIQFNGAMETKHFVCLEMLENRPWIFQPDCFCLAATIHSVLFGRYLDVKKVGENYRADIKIPRYFNAVWGRFFREFVEIPEGSRSPDFQKWKKSFEEIITELKDLHWTVARFNQLIAERKSRAV